MVALFAASTLVAGHGAIVKAVGDQGGVGAAIGVDPDTPRDGTRRNPFQQDSTRFKGDNADTCGQTLGGGENDIIAGTKAVMAMMGGTLPQISASGEISMTLHQVNGDGGGPYTCQIDPAGDGSAFVDMKVTTQVAGTNSRSNAKAVDLPLKAAIPAGQTCSGNVAGMNNICMVRCMNAARAGPFGGCVPVQMANAAVSNSAAVGNSTAAGNSTAPAKRAVETTEDEEDDE
ncbi:hypothetical protein EG328_011376 [Venturia inaequalis]|uniref:GEgh 16 protein n=1 Tax=Venturia inaequalis TaxID=5025 RepID=A0A8H3U553_VENIN|nr:hypothetical protein EG328_011376 [Venturia inaequalis]